MDNKHKAMLDYLSQYPGLDAFLRFNSVTDELGNVSVQTVYGDKWERQYIGGHGIKRYDFAVVTMNPQDPGTSRVNADQMEDVEGFMAWIEEQNKARNFPDFDGCKVLSIENLQNMPNLAGVNSAGNVAKYMMQCRVRYYV